MGKESAEELIGIMHSDFKQTEPIAGTKNTTGNCELDMVLHLLRLRRKFDAGLWIEKKVELLNNYMRENNLSACVIGVSGGVDSAVTFALAHRAMNVENSPIKRLIAMAQPIHSTPGVQNRAYELGRAFNHEILTIDQSDIFDSLCKRVDLEIDINTCEFARGQMKSYMRTPLNFYVAQLLTCQGLKAIVLGTGNMDEDGYLYYFCKAGDGVADIQLIADIHKSEVFLVGKHLGVPESILTAAPTADLWEGQTDEDELGVSYDFVELYTEFLKLHSEEQTEIKNNLSPPCLTFFKNSGTEIEQIHKRNAHKALFPLNLNVI